MCSSQSEELYDKLCELHSVRDVSEPFKKILKITQGSGGSAPGWGPGGRAPDGGSGAAPPRKKIAILSQNLLRFSSLLDHDN